MCVSGGVENYLFLFKLAMKMLYRLINISYVELYLGCENCHHDSYTGVHHIIDFSESINSIDREYTMNMLSLEAIQLTKIGFINPENLIFDRLKFEKDKASVDAEMLENLIKEHQLKMESIDFIFKKIHVNCSAQNFGKIFGKIINETKNDKDLYLFEYEMTSLAIAIVTIFHFDIGNQVSARTMRNYLPAFRANK